MKEVPQILNNNTLYTIFKLLPALTIENLTFTPLTYQLLDKKKQIVRKGTLQKGHFHPILEIDTNSELSLRVGIPERKYYSTLLSFLF